MEPVLISISFFGTIFGIWFYYLKTRNAERLALIQSGADASLFYSKKRPAQSGMFLVLILGMLFLSIGLGIIMGHLIEHAMISQGKTINTDHFRRSYPQAYFTSIFIFSGLGMIASYYLIRKIQRNEPKNIA